MARKGNTGKVDNLPDEKLGSKLVTPYLGKNYTYCRKLAITNKEQLRFIAECPVVCCDAHWDYPLETKKFNTWKTNELEKHVYKLLAVHLAHNHFRNLETEDAICWCGYNFGPLPYMVRDRELTSPGTLKDITRNEYAQSFYQHIIDHCCDLNSSVSGHFQAYLAQKAITQH